MRSLSLGRRPTAFLCLSFHSSVLSEGGGRTTEGTGLWFQNYLDLQFSGNVGGNLATAIVLLFAFHLGICILPLWHAVSV